MFLVTTGLIETLPKDKKQKVLFLGEWCKLYSKRDVWSAFEYETVPYHWDDRKKLYDDYIYLDNIYEKYLKKLVGCLNREHKVEYSERYWRILIGPWLYWFIAIVFDRYTSIKEVNKINEKISASCVLKSDYSNLLPNDMNIFVDYALGDNWNHFIYSELIKFFGFLKYDLSNILNIPKTITENNNNTSLKNYIIKCGYNLFKNFIRCPFSSTNVEYNDFYYNKGIISKLLIFPFLAQEKVKHFSPDYAKRDNLQLGEFSGEFEKFLNYIIPLQMPQIYLEGYKGLNKIIEKKYPKKTKVIHTETACFFNDCFKLWSAGLVEQGSKLVTSQHGGNMGSAKWAQYEKHQVSISDKFYTWGWKADNEVIRRMPAIKLCVGEKKIKKDKKGKILLVLGETPRYSYHHV